MIWLLLALMALLAAVAVFFLRPGRRQKPRPLADTRHPATPRPIRKAKAPWGMKLVVDTEACEEAKALEGICFAYVKAPHLPLPGCTRVGCTCRFETMDERRSGAERRSGEERRVDVRFETKLDRRSGQDRRQDRKHYQWNQTI